MTRAVHIERLPVMRVASFRAFGEAPEAEAWRRLRQWAGTKGLLEDADRHPIFGFNNPSPSAGQTEYGYELWISAGPEPDDGQVAFKEFEGGLFAVTTCSLQGDPGIGAAWRKLWDWAQASPYRWRRAQELEKVINPGAPEADLILDLYLPVHERAESAT
jgi:DNA gyrase inhibitor GyrI